MMLNKWIDNINRLKISRPSKEEMKRLDCAERISNFDNSLFKSFINDIEQEDLITYPSYADYENLEKKISKFLSIDNDQISLGTGSDSCIKDLMQITLNDQKEVVSLTPCFPMYFIYASTFNSKFVPVSYEEFQMNGLKAYFNAISSKTSLVILTNPGSPFGYYLSCSEIEELAIFTLDKNITLLIDEAYIEFAPGDSISLVKNYPNIFISRTFSKAWGAAGCRVGYLISQKENIDKVSKVKLTYPVNSIALKFIGFLIDNYDSIEKYIKKSIIDREKLCDYLENSGYEVIRSHTNTIHFHQKNGDNSYPIEILDSHKVAFKAGSKKTGTAVRVPGDNRDTWIRLSLGAGILDTKYIKEILKKG